MLLSTPQGETAFDFHQINRHSDDIAGAHIYHQPPVERSENLWTAERLGDLFVDLLADGTLDTLSLISHDVSYEPAPNSTTDLARTDTRRWASCWSGSNYSRLWH